jgi:PPOX class probable F420-dependent enzyme
VSVHFTDDVRRLLDGPNLAFVSTVDAEGAPRVQPTWIGTDGTNLLLNTQEGRAWPRRLRRSGRVSVAIANAADQSEYVEIRGHVVKDTNDGARANIDELSRTYIGVDYPNHFEGEVRVLFRIEPDHVIYVNLTTGTQLTFSG